MEGINSVKSEIREGEFEMHYRGERVSRCSRRREAVEQAWRLQICTSIASSSSSSNNNNTNSAGNVGDGGSVCQCVSLDNRPTDEKHTGGNISIMDEFGMDERTRRTDATNGRSSLVEDYDVTTKNFIGIGK